MNIITHSSMTVFNKCKRRYQYQYVQGRVKVRDDLALSVGSAWHRAIEAWWRSTDRLQAAILNIQANSEGLEAQEIAKLLAMVEAYKPPVDDFEALALEQPFTTMINNPETGRAMRDYSLAGKVDGLIRKKADGSVWVLEHKTTSQEILGFGDYWQRVSISQQLGLYRLGTQASGCIYDVVRKPSIKLCGKDKDEDSYRKRCLVQRQEDPAAWHQWRELPAPSESDIYENQLDLWDNAHLIAESTRRGRYPRNSEACADVYGSCPYLAVCTGQARIEDETLFRSKNQEHEELAA